MNFYKHHLGDYEGATAHLSWDEDQAYTRLLRVYYRLEKPIPVDTGAACRLTRAKTTAQRQAVETVLREFFDLQEDGWHNKRADEEIVAYQAQADTNRRIAHERTVRRTVNDSLTKGPPNHKPVTKNQDKSKGAGAFAPPDWVPLDAWTAWLDVRRKKRAPNTDEALRLSVLDLERLRAAGQDPRAVLEQSTKRGWQGIFELKADSLPQAVPVQQLLGKCQCGAAATMKVGGKPRCVAHVRGMEAIA